MSALLGLNAKLYTATSRATWGTLGTDGYTHEAAAPAGLSVVDNVKDLSANIEVDSADVTTRGNNGWKASLSTLKDAEISFDMVYDPSDAQMLVFQKAFFTNATLPVAVLDGLKSVVGTRGLWMDTNVSKFDKTENLSDAQMVSVSLKPAYSTVAPEAVKVTA